MAQITTRLPDELVASLEHAARTLHRPRAEIVRLAIERYLEDFDDLNVAVERLQADPLRGTALSGDSRGVGRSRARDA